LAAIELELIAHMLHTGDLSPLHKGLFREEHCLTNEGKNLHQFLAMYRHVSQGASSIPTRAVILNRFQNFDLPEPVPHADLNALVHETRLEAMRAHLREFSVDIQSMAEAVDPLAELDLARKRLEDIASESAVEEEYGFDSHLDLILEQYYAGQLLPYGIPWPWPSLNEATHGMQKGEFNIISGRPKTRKTFIALAAMVHAFVNFGTRILVFTPEMHPFMILLRSAAIAAGLRYSQFKKGKLDPFEEFSLLETVEKFGKLDNSRFIRVDQFGNDIPPDLEEVDAVSDTVDGRQFANAMFKVIKSTNRSTAFIQSKIRQLKPHAVLCDSFYRQAPEGLKKSDSDVKAQTAVSRELKNIFAEEEVAGVGTHQINREGNRKIGDLSNLAYADAFGQDADSVMRAVTEKRKGAPDVTALVMLGARETELDGVIINNVPCSDFSEVKPITDLSEVRDMLKKEAEQLDEEKKGEKKKKTASPSQVSQVSEASKGFANAKRRRKVPRV